MSRSSLFPVPRVAYRRPPRHARPTRVREAAVDAAIAAERISRSLSLSPSLFLFLFFSSLFPFFPFLFFSFLLSPSFSLSPFCSVPHARASLSPSAASTGPDLALPRAVEQPLAARSPPCARAPPAAHEHAHALHAAVPSPTCTALVAPVAAQRPAPPTSSAAKPAAEQQRRVLRRRHKAACPARACPCHHLTPCSHSAACAARRLPEVSRHQCAPRRSRRSAPRR